jgi:hypothetical protein
MRARQQARPWRRVRERWRRANGDARSSPSAALDERPRTSRSGPSSWAFAVWDRSNDHCTTARRLHSRPRRTIGRGAARRKNSVPRLAGAFNGQFRSSLCITLMSYVRALALPSPRFQNGRNSEAGLALRISFLFWKEILKASHVRDRSKCLGGSSS